jgi:hypothetical protein
MLLLKNTEGIFPTRRFCLACFHVLTKHCIKLIHLQVFPCSLKGKFYLT